MKPYDYHVFVCVCSTCSKKGVEDVLHAFWEKTEDMGLPDRVKVTRTGCISLGECEYGPLVVVYPEGVWYRSVTVDDVTEIIEEHLIGHHPLSRLLHFKL